MSCLATTPIPIRPAGYVGLANYSNISSFHRILEAAERSGRVVSLLRSDGESIARRRVSGYALQGAAIFADLDFILREVKSGDHDHPALADLMGGSSEALYEIINAHFEFKLDFVVALTSRQELICRPEFKFAEIVKGLSGLPEDFQIRARRSRVDEINILLLKACGMLQERE